MPYLCGAPMEPEQDWCLNCGTAAPGRLGERPGWRAASTVIVLALLLVLGAVGAGYAALTGDSQPQQTASTPAAAAPPAAAQAAPPAATTQPPAATTQPPATTSTTPAKPQAASEGQDADVRRHARLAHHADADDRRRATSTGDARRRARDHRHRHRHGHRHRHRHRHAGTGTTGDDHHARDTGPTPIELTGDAGTVYDPFKRAKASGDDDARRSTATGRPRGTSTPRSRRRSPSATWSTSASSRACARSTCRRRRPGFRVEIYATDETTPPPDILDTRWSHIKDVSNVGAKDDGKQKIVLGAGTTKYRNVLLWFTQPPTDGPRLRLAELELLG